ncbi:hypothetical protein [Nocardioides ultimimeridianus]
MAIRSRAVVAALASAAILTAGLTASSQAATTSLASQPATASVCRYGDNQLTSIVAKGPRVREQDWFRTHHVRQHSRYQAGLQRLVGSSWTTVDGSTQKRTPLLAATTTTMPQLTLAVPYPAEGRYRVLTVIRWLSRSGSVARTQRMVLAHYSSGTSSCAATIPAPTVTVAANAGQVWKGSAVGGSFTVSNLRGSATASVVLWGPSPCDACSYDSAQSFQVPVSGNGTYSLPTGTLSSSGVYRWAVVVSNAAQSSDGAWSGAMYSLEAVNWSLTSPSGDASLNRSASAGPVQLRLSFAGFHYTTSVDETATIWGPYDTLAAADAAACTGTQHNTGPTHSFQIGSGGTSYIITDDLHAYVGKFFRVSTAGAVTSNTAIETLTTPKLCSTTFRVTS